MAKLIPYHAPAHLRDSLSREDDRKALDAFWGYLVAYHRITGQLQMMLGITAMDTIRAARGDISLSPSMTLDGDPRTDEPLCVLYFRQGNYIRVQTDDALRTVAMQESFNSRVRWLG